ncbi:MAG: DUF2600 family protein [Solirubrobacteraceae bacterium]
MSSVFRELTWGLPRVSRELDRWRRYTRLIPDAELREDATHALVSKRGQATGAALFAVLPRHRHVAFLRFLVAYQTIWDYLDDVHERAPTQQNGRQLHLALVDALDLTRDASTRYYAYHPWDNDGGYLAALVGTCRRCCAEIPAYEQVRPLIVEEAVRAQVLAINHERDPNRRDAAMKNWAAFEFPHAHDARWFELTGAASAGLTIFALLALACEPTCSDQQIRETRSVYMPWVSAAACMLDSYADQADDAKSGNHSYVKHYTSADAAVSRIRTITMRCMEGLQTLHNGERHLVIVASMLALYLTKDSARASPLRAQTEQITASGGSLTRTLIPVLRIWRVANAQRAT